jgi:branched-chain amino acid transport system substrate-binding protein
MAETRRVALALAAALLLSGCGASTSAIVGGGTVPGTTRTVYSMLPRPAGGAAHDMVLGEKLAVEEAGGRAGPYGLNFVSLDEAAADPAQVSARAGTIAEQAIHDAQVIAIIGGPSSEAAQTTIPLINAAGILQLLPGAGYPGFTRPWIGRDEPAHYQPAGNGRNLVRLVGDDTLQARALLQAAARASGGARPRVAIESEPSLTADSLNAALTDAAPAAHVRLVDSTERADAVVYAGDDPVNAAGVADAIARERKPIVLGDALVFAGVAGRLSPAARRRAVLVSSAPAPGAAAHDALAPRFREAFGRGPGPYALMGYEAMRSVIAAIDSVGGRDSRRQAVIAAFRPPPVRAFTAYRADGRALAG